MSKPRMFWKRSFINNVFLLYRHLCRTKNKNNLLPPLCYIMDPLRNDQNTKHKLCEYSCNDQFVKTFANTDEYSLTKRSQLHYD
jgi:hypothetical protein